MPAPNQQPPNPRRFHFDATINLGHILTTVTLIVSLFAWGSAIDKRLAIVEERERALAHADSVQAEQFQNAVILLRNELQRVADKLDHVLEQRERR